MRKRDAAALARLHMEAHGLTDLGWTFGFTRAKRQAGVTKFTSKTIGLSAPYVELNDEDEIEDTILHEIAHAKVGAAAGHGPKWKLMARALGANPERCIDGDSVNMPPGKWSLVCPTCERVAGTLHRRSKKRRSCSKCSRGRFNPEHLLQWVLTEELSKESAA